MTPIQAKAICEALGFDPTNHHNAAKCPYCTNPAPPWPAPRECEVCAYRLNINGTCPNDACHYRKVQQRGRFGEAE